jgi:hypothetical protein
MKRNGWLMTWTQRQRQRQHHVRQQLQQQLLLQRQMTAPCAMGHARDRATTSAQQRRPDAARRSRSARSQAYEGGAEV